jgi:hypothetical protein
VVTAQGALAIRSWSIRWNATCPAMPSANVKTAEALANRRVRSLIAWSVASQARSA